MLQDYIKADRLPVPKCGQRYTITPIGELYDQMYNRFITPTIDKFGRRVVKVQLNGSSRFYQLARLVALTFKPLHFEFKYWKHVRLMFVDGNKDNIHPGNMVWRFPKEGIPYIGHVGWWHIPGYSRYAMCENTLSIVDTLTQKNKSICTNQYKSVSIGTDAGTKRGYMHHRLVALTFLRYPANADSLLVNHLDGDKHNNYPDNLEWTDYSGNIIHAFKTGLRGDNIRVKVRDVETGEVKEYYSCTECGNAHNVTETTVTNRIKNDYYIYDGKYQFKYADDETGWPEIRIRPKPTPITTDPRICTVLARNVHTKQIIISAGYNPMSRYLKACTKIIAERLHAGDQIPYKGWQFQFKVYLKDWIEWTDEELREFELQYEPRGRRIKVTDRNTGIVTDYVSIKEFANELGIDKAWVNNCLRRGKPYKHYTLDYI